MNSASTMPDISRRAWHSQSINIVLVFSTAKVRLRQRCGYGQEHGNGEAEWVEHSECLQTSMGRLDPTESGEEGGGTIEGEGTSFYFHQGQMLDIICPCIPIYIWGVHIYYIPQIQWGVRYSAVKRNVYYRNYQWVYSNSRDFHGNTRTPPPGLSDRVLCNAMRNRAQLIAIIRGGK